MKQYKNALSDLLGPGGVKADVSIRVDAESIAYISIALIVSFILANIASHYIIKSISK